LSVIALYPGSFDPITNGHLDIVTRAAKLFDKVILGIYKKPDKRLLFTTEERVELARLACAGIPNVTVTEFGGLTVDFARKAGAKVVVRGLRKTADFEWELDMAMMNKYLAPDLELVCFMATLKYQFLSSSLLKEVANLGSNVDNLVPKAVADALKKKIIEGKL
jgi:pantetheine-phosphate adenylyltransferase